MRLAECRSSVVPPMLWASLPAIVLLAACSGLTTEEFGLRELPDDQRFCIDAQRVVTRTSVPVELVIHEDFDAFVSSKAIIDGPEGPQIQQYNWFDADGRLLGISCKLKSADHLRLEFGEDSAGPDGACQDMNQAVFQLVSRTIRQPAYRSVIFDAAETVSNEDQPGMTGPDWLAPYTMTYADDQGALHIAAKGFVVDFTDPLFAKAPERFRGVHYCHFIAPDHLEQLLRGNATPGVQIGKRIPADRPNPGPTF